MRRFIAALAAPAFFLTSAAAWAGESVIPIVRTPEPASLMLLASGIAGVALVRRFKRRK